MLNSALFQMTMPRLTLLGALGVAITSFTSIPPVVEAQVYSARRLTQRIAPQLTPAPTNAPRPLIAQPLLRPVQPPADPEKVQAEKDETLRKTVDFRKQRAAEGSESAEDKSATNSLKVSSPPLLIACTKVEPDPRQSLQYITLSLNNTASKPISDITMRLIYCEATGDKLKEWTTSRELDQPLGRKVSMELIQPAYFMPWITKKVKVEVKEVRFSDGTLWVPSAPAW